MTQSETAPLVRYSLDRSIEELRIRAAEASLEDYRLGKSDRVRQGVGMTVRLPRARAFICLVIVCLMSTTTRMGVVKR